MNGRDLAAARIHRCDQTDWCFGPTPKDYAAADAEALLTDTEGSKP